MIAKRHSKANQPHLIDYNSSEWSRCIMFLDANNLYGKAMMEPLPVGGFRWMRDAELSVDFVCSLSD